MPTLVQIEAFKQKAKAKGFTDAQIQASITKKIQTEAVSSGLPQQGPQRPTPVAPTAPTTPTAPTMQATQPVQKKSLLRKGVDFLAGGASRFGDALGNAAGMASTENSFQSTQKQYLDSSDQLTKRAIELKKAGRKAESDKLFKMAQESIETARKEANKRISDAQKGKEDTVKGAVGTAANFIPGGGTLPMKIASGITAGAMSGYGASDTGKGLEGAVAGGTIGGALPVAGAVIGKGIKAGKNALTKVGSNLTQGAGEKATQDFIKASPSGFSKAITEHGIDPRELYKKYAKGKSYDELLGMIKNKGKGGILETGLDEAEKAIQKTIKTSGNNVRISGDDLIKALTKESKSISKELGGQNRSEAIKEIIRQASLKYKKGLTVKQAMETLRTANEKFGKSVVDDAGDAVATGAQKLEANTLRSTLKKMFPSIADALDKQSEILTFRPMIEKARATTLTTGAGKSTFSVSDLIAGLSTGAAGMSVAGPLGAVAGFGLGVGGRKLAESPAGEKALGGLVSGVASKIPTGGMNSTLSRVGGNIASAVGGSIVGGISPLGQQPTDQSNTQPEQTSTNDELNKSYITPSETNADIVAPTANDAQTSNDLFHGMSKREVLTLAVQKGAGEADLKKISDLYDQVAPKADEWSGMTVAELAKSRKDLTEGGYDTSAIDKELQKRGVGRSSTAGTPKPIIEQINNLPTANERNGARAVKDIMDVVDSAITSAKDTPTGPLSAGGAGLSKLTTPNKTAKLEKDLGEILRTIRKESTGVAFSDKEIEALLVEIPKISQQEGNVEDSLARLKQRMIQKLMNYEIDVTESLNSESSKKKTESNPISEVKTSDEPSSQEAVDKANAMTNIMFSAGPDALNQGAKKLSESKNPVLSTVGKVAKVATSFIAPSDEQVALLMKGYKDPKSLSEEERKSLASSALMSTAGTVAPLSGQKIGKILPNVDEEDLKGMVKLLDYARTKMVNGKKVGPEMAVEIEKNARYIAEGMKINPDQANAKLANVFEQILNSFRKRAVFNFN